MFVLITSVVGISGSLPVALLSLVLCVGLFIHLVKKYVTVSLVEQ